jgi:type IV secretory pathway VirB6-like protein
MLHIWHASPWYDKVLVGLLLWFVIGDVALALGSIYFAFLTANFILYVLLAAGPVFIVLAAFEATAGAFRFWRDAVITGLLYILTLDVMLGFFTVVIGQLINSVNVGVTTPWTDMIPSVLGAVIVFNVMAFAVGVFTLQIGRINSLSTRGIDGAMGMAAAAWTWKNAR